MGQPSETAYARHYERVVRFVRRRSPNREGAEDLAQTVFADALSILEEQEAEEPETLALLYTVARRRIADELRSFERGPAAIVPLAEATTASDAYEPGLASALLRALGQLTDEQRCVVVMKLFEGRRFAEISAILGISEAAAKMRFARGLAALRDILREEGVRP
jgi:RNA polymerase sigma-70 factor, ECF subfamily